MSEPSFNIDFAQFDASQLGPQIRIVASGWRELLNRREQLIVATAPPFETVNSHDPDLAQELAALPALKQSWSILAHGCEMRDRFKLCEQRVSRIKKSRKHPVSIPGFDIADRAKTYSHDKPSKAAWDLAIAAGSCADSVERFDSADWSLTAQFSDGSVLSAEALVRNRLTDSAHRLEFAQRLIEILLDI